MFEELVVGLSGSKICILSAIPYCHSIIREQIERGRECWQEDSLEWNCKDFWCKIVEVLTRMFCKEDGEIWMDSG